MKWECKTEGHARHYTREGAAGVEKHQFTFTVQVVPSRRGRRIPRRWRDQALRSLIEQTFKPAPTGWSPKVRGERIHISFEELLKILANSFPALHRSDIRRLAHRLKYRWQRTGSTERGKK